MSDKEVATVKHCFQAKTGQQMPTQGEAIDLDAEQKWRSGDSLKQWLGKPLLQEGIEDGESARQSLTDVATKSLKS